MMEKDAERWPIGRKGRRMIYLRILPSTQQAVHVEWERVLTLYGEQELAVSFLVVGPGRHRIRKVGPSTSI